MSEPVGATGPGSAPGLFGRLRARYGWLDHVVRAQTAYNTREGDFYAAALTYFTLFAVFPMLMLGFAVAGFLLASRPLLLDRLFAAVRDVVNGTAEQQLIDLIEAAIDSRTSVGLIGLGVAVWAGLSWMDKLRESLDRMWGRPRDPDADFVHTKLSDLLALASMFVAVCLTLVLTAVSSPTTVHTVLGWIGIRQVSGVETLVRVASSLAALGLSLLVSWLLFTWVMTRLPRGRMPFAAGSRAGWIVAVGFEVFKQAGAAYLKSVVGGPAGAVFGPVLGLLVFAYITTRLLLFATAWAAEDDADTAAAGATPDPAGD